MDAAWWGDVIKQFLITVAGSSVGMGLLKLWYDHRTAKTKRDEQVRHLASQIVFDLEGYVVDITDRLQDQRTYNSSDGHHGREMNGLPEFPEWPKSEHYPLLDYRLVGRLYELPQERMIVGTTVNAVYDYSDPDDAEVRFVEEGFHLTVKVLDLIRDMRERYGLGHRHLGPEDWDMAEYVRDTYATLRQQRLDFERRNQEAAERMMKENPPPPPPPLPSPP